MTAATAGFAFAASIRWLIVRATLSSSVAIELPATGARRVFTVRSLIA